MISYIGLDAHSATCTAVVVNEKGDILCRKTFPTTEAQLIGFLEAIPGVKHLTFEECHLAQWLYVTLVEYVDQLLVCNPVYVAKKTGCKNGFPGRFAPGSGTADRPFERGPPRRESLD